MYHLRGTVDDRGIDNVIIEAGGVGYKILVPISTAEKMPRQGAEVKLFIVESTAMYGGSTTCYGFLTREERDFFSLLKDEVPGAGARKALDYLDKVTKSLPDFRRAVMGRDIAALTGIFGFTRKTAEKLAAALKDKIGGISLSGKEKWEPLPVSSPAAEAIAGLVALGYKEGQARESVEKATADTSVASVEDILRRALTNL